MKRHGASAAPVLALLLIVGLVGGALPLEAQVPEPSPEAEKSSQEPIDESPAPPQEEPDILEQPKEADTRTATHGEADALPLDELPAAKLDSVQSFPEGQRAMSLASASGISSVTVEYPNHPSCCKKSAVTNGDSITLYVYLTEWDSTKTVRADLSALGGGEVTLEPIPELSLYAAFYVRLGTELTSGTAVIPVALYDGDELIDTTSTEVRVDVDPPQATIEFMPGTPYIAQYKDAYVSGTIAEDASGIRAVEGRRFPYDAQGTLISSPFNWGGASHAMSQLRGGPFTDVPVMIGEFHEEAQMAAFRMAVLDGAGNWGYATTSPIRYYPEGQEPPPPPEVSNVLFLPGIKGSRLYTDGGEKLWEPGLFDNDVEELFLDENGKSLRTDIYVPSGIAGVIDEIPGTRLYTSFMEDMNALVDAGNMADWEAVPYDWRLSLYDLIENGTERDGRIYYNEATSTPYIEQTLRRLAASSKTGKVTIVAHSNGGLVTKALLHKLGDAETAALVDNVVFVGVPQSGAPQALGAILYGYKEGIPDDRIPLLVNTVDARKFALNSPMGYHLLPSDSYFNNVSSVDRPVGIFLEGGSYALEKGAYGNILDSYTELESFILASAGERLQPHPSDIKSAAIGNDSLLNYAFEAHRELDSWIPPSEVNVYEVGGTGNRYISGIEFYGIAVPFFDPLKLYRPLFSKGGDGVVPIESAHGVTHAGNIQSFWINVGGGSFDHTNLLEVSALREGIKSLLLFDELSAPELSQSRIDAPPFAQELRLFLHSPLTLEAHDESGNHTGPSIDETEVEEEIDGSDYGTFGEVQYLILPGDKPYEFVLNGKDSGTFTFEIQQVLSGEVTTTTTFANVPASASTVASLEYDPEDQDELILAVDSDGNGEAEITLKTAPNETLIYQQAEQEETSNTSSGGSSIKKRGTNSPVTSASSSAVTATSSSDALPASHPALEIRLEEKGNAIVIPEEKEQEIIDGVRASSPSQTAAIHDAISQHSWFSQFMSLLYSAVNSVWHWLQTLFS